MCSSGSISLIALPGVDGMIYIGSQSKFIPYVVKVDKLGQTIAVSPVNRAGVDQGVIIVVAASTRLQRWRQDDYQMPASMSHG